MTQWKKNWKRDCLLQRYLREDKGIEMVDLCSHKKTRVKEKRKGKSLGGRYGRKHIDGAQRKETRILCVFVSFFNFLNNCCLCVKKQCKLLQVELKHASQRAF